MMDTDIALKPPASTKRTNSLLSRIIQHKAIYLLLLPGLIYFLIFKILPMWGLMFAFKDYNPYLGFGGSPWVGVKHFADLFHSEQFFIMLRNTLAINLIGLVFHFPMPILLALMLNEIRHEGFKRLQQSIVYMPHFLSWVVVASMTFFLLSVDVGIINKLIAATGGETISFLSKPNYFWGLLTAQSMWKEAGWGTIIFLAAMAGVDPQRYEAAVVDGAGRFRQIWHITLPAIRPTIIILLIMRLGHLADTGFEQILLMMNPLVRGVGEVFDTYAYTYGILQGQVSVGVTMGLFKGILGLVLIVTANKVVRRLGHEGIY